ncbi:Alkaline phosphatase 3 [Pelomyxa schiedti]|nr:Alkaline phosphatase 3 [Pelomyxa schiedti]
MNESQPLITDTGETSPTTNSAILTAEPPPSTTTAATTTTTTTTSPSSTTTGTPTHGVDFDVEGGAARGGGRHGGHRKHKHRKLSARRVAAFAVAGVLAAVAVGCVLVAVGVRLARSDDDDAGGSRSVALVINDGMSFAALTLGRVAGGYGVDGSPVDEYLVGSLRTWSGSSWVTDSAAGGTALGCATKTINGYVGVDTAGNPVASLAYAAKRKGMGTAIVAKSRLTDATPAAFTSHIISRKLEEDIAAQQIDSGVDVIIAGGNYYFLPENREDGRDLLAEAATKGYMVITSIDDLYSHWENGTLRYPLFALVTSMDVGFSIDDPDINLPDMVSMALEIVPKPFFMMAECSLIDYAEHAHDPAAAFNDVVEFFDVFTTLRAYSETPLLVVAVSDHETGGLGLGGNNYSYNPVALSRVNASSRSMANMMFLGQDPTAVLEEYAGITPTEDELTTIAAALQTNATILSIALGNIVSDSVSIYWTTLSHTGADIPLFAANEWDPPDIPFGANNDNTAVPLKIAEYLGLDLAEATNELREQMGKTTMHSAQQHGRASKDPFHTQP